MQKMQPINKRLSGFTLMEVLIAFAVMIILIGGLSYTLSEAKNWESQLRHKTFARWVAVDDWTQIRFERLWLPVGQASHQVLMGPWSFSVTRTVENTAYPSVRHVSVGVRVLDSVEMSSYKSSDKTKTYDSVVIKGLITEMPRKI
jgi:type II secretion system protein I